MKTFFFTLLLFCAISMDAATFTIATYNIRNANQSDSLAGNGWGRRYPYIAQLIRFHGFDVFGTQEGKYHQLEELKAALPGYDYIGIGRDDGKKEGEFSAIFYRTDRFEVLEHGDFWLSTETSYPNKGWDAVLPRICTWGKFKDKESGFIFLYFNLHMDHIGVQARAESAKLILQKIAAQPAHIPVVLSGDFNVDQHSESYQLLNTSGIMKDAYESAELRYAPNGTFNGFYPDRMTDQRLDHIFLTDDFKVLKYGILTDSYRSPKEEEVASEQNANFPKEARMKPYDARIPSDHFPVMIVVSTE